MELREYASVLKRWVWLIVVGAIVAGVAAFVLSKAMKPVYRATTTLLVNQAASAAPVTDYTSVLTSQQLAKTYSELIKKRPILQAAIERLQFNVTPEDVVKRLDVTPVRDTTLISVSLEDENPVFATGLLNQIAAVFIEKTNELQRSRFASSEDNLSKELKQLQTDADTTQKALDKARASSVSNPDEVARLQTVLSQYQTNYAGLLKSYEDLRITEARTLDSVTVAEPAALPDNPVRPQIVFNTMLAAAIGGLLAIGIAFLLEYLDDTLKSPDNVRSALDLVTMGTITQFEHKPDDLIACLPIVNTPRAPISEAFRALRTNIQFASVDHKIRTLMVTSPSPGEGKTTIATNLAAALAQAGQTVALVDCDLRRPSVHRWLNIANSGGLTSATLTSGQLNGFLQTTAVENLYALPSGPLPPNPAELLGSERVGTIIEDLKRQVDIVILDTPPALVVTDPSVLAKRVDAVLLVVETGGTRKDAARQAVEGLTQVGANVIGAVLNKNSPRRGGYAYHGNKYGYYYSTETGEKKKQKVNAPPADAAKVTSPVPDTEFVPRPEPEPVFAQTPVGLKRRPFMRGAAWEAEIYPSNNGGNGEN